MLCVPHPKCRTAWQRRTVACCTMVEESSHTIPSLKPNHTHQSIEHQTNKLYLFDFFSLLKPFFSEKKWSPTHPTSRRKEKKNESDYQQFKLTGLLLFRCLCWLEETDDFSFGELGVDALLLSVSSSLSELLSSAASLRGLILPKSFRVGRGASAVGASSERDFNVTDVISSRRNFCRKLGPSQNRGRPLGQCV